MDGKFSTLRNLFFKHKELIMYCVFGVTTTVVNWLIYSLCVRGLGLNLYVSGIVAWIVAVIVAFVTNKLWVFESKSWEPLLLLKEVIAFVGGRVLTGVLEVIAVPALVDWGLDITLFNVEGLPAKIIVSMVIVILNYILSKFIAFGGANHADK